MAKAESFLARELAPCCFELRDGGGVCVNPGSELPSLFLPFPILPPVFKSVVPVESCAGDEESCLDDSTGGNARSGLEEK
jgi:hypothetical protein